MVNEQPRVGYVPGVFDMFHIGHLNILKRSHERCDVLIAGVVTDEACEAMKCDTVPSCRSRSGSRSSRQ